MPAYVPLPALEGPALALARLLACDEEAFVTEAYRALLGRDPDPRGMRDRLEQLAAGSARMAVLAGIADSAEARSRGPIHRALAELVIAQARRRDAIPRDIDELLALADGEFVMASYRFVLGRDADTGGREHYVARLRSGEPKVDIVAALRHSPEGEERARSLRGAGGAPAVELLDRAIARQAWARVPLIGTLLAAILGLEAYSPAARRMRRTENVGARTAAALGLGAIDAPAESPAPQSAAAPATPDEPCPVRVSSGMEVSARLITLPAAFQVPASPRA
jgi:hypothetical protein